MRDLFVLAVAAAVLVSASYLQFSRAANPGGAAIGSPAPAFTLQDQTGKNVSLADLKGKVVVLEWFNEGCPFTRRVAKAGIGNSLAEQYQGKDVVWLAVNSTNGSTNASNAAAAKELSVRYPILNDSTGAVGKAYGAKTTPHIFIIDKAGNLAYAGGLDDDPTGGAANRKNYVADALGALTSGKSVSVAETKPYGCGVKYGK